MTSTTSLNHTIGLSYRDRIWCAWRYPSGKPDELRAFVGHSRENAVEKCCAGLPSGVADAFGRLVVDTAGAPQRAIRDAAPKEWRPKVLRVANPRCTGDSPLKYAVGTIHGNIRITGKPSMKTSTDSVKREYFPCVCQHCGAEWLRRRSALRDCEKLGPGGRCGKCPDARGKRSV